MRRILIAGSVVPLLLATTGMSQADTTPPTSPVLSVGQVTAGRIAVSWTASTDETPVFLRYTLLVDGAPRPDDLVEGRSQTLLDLTPATTYTMVVRVSDLWGNTAFSNPVSAITPPRTDMVAPSAPANLRGRDDGGGCEAYLSWDRSTDNTDPQAALIYRLSINGVNAPRSTVRFVGRTTAFQQSMRPGVNSFVVTALDSAGNVSALSNELLLEVRGC